MASYTPNYATVPQTGYAPGMGRVDIASPARLPPINNGAGFNNSGANANSRGENAPNNELTCVFFSKANIDALQEAIRYRVYTATNGSIVIGRQSDQELQIVMRSMYYQYGQNLAYDVLPQVRALNVKVLDYAVPEVLSNARQYEKYKKDVSTLPVPLPHAPLATMKGTRTLEISRFF